MQNDLQHLKNLGNTSINWLRTVGIVTHQDLIDVGAIEAYNRIQSRGIKVSKVLLYALHGALHDTLWTELSEETKKQLIEEASSKAQSLKAI